MVRQIPRSLSSTNCERQRASAPVSATICHKCDPSTLFPSAGQDNSFSEVPASPCTLRQKCSRPHTGRLFPTGTAVKATFGEKQGRQVVFQEMLQQTGLFYRVRLTTKHWITPICHWKAALNWFALAFYTKGIHTVHHHLRY